jgi:hypothetical protein
MNLLIKKSFAAAAFAGMFAFLALTATNIVSAQQFPGGNLSDDNIANDQGVGSGDPTKDAFQIVSCDGAQKFQYDQTGHIMYGGDGKPLLDPKSKECDLAQLIFTARRIIQFALFALTPIVIGMILYTGFKYMTAGGDANLIADAKRMGKPIIIGLVLIFGAWLIVYTLLDKLLADKIGGVDKSTIVPSGISK